MRIRNLLLPAPCNDQYSPAFEQTVALATAMDANVFSVFDQAALLRHSEHYSQAKIPGYETLADRFKAFAGQVGIPPLQHHLVVGSCSHTLSAYANRCEYDLMVIGCPHNPWQRETLQYLLSHLKCSLIVVNTAGTPIQQAARACTDRQHPFFSSI
ncbi:universal stress protein [Pseudomonas sp. p21]|uniref:universal stress protein n=1 Tax=Pseudomonas sp. p21 TaxID=1825979 RepID=UPI0009ED0D02|nr:universal stress protein [Pseudomonas sp. p21]